MSKFSFLLLLDLLFSSCDNKKNENSNDSPSKNENSRVIYERNGDCDTFIQGIDFSSLCVTSNKLLEYEVEFPSKIRCQYQILKDDWKQETHFVITWKDYANYSKEKMEMDQLLTKNAFQKTGKRLYEKTKKIDNLGDDAYIGYEEIDGSQDKHLAINLNNVTVRISTNWIDDNCLSSDDELLKLGRLIIDRIKS